MARPLRSRLRDRRTPRAIRREGRHAGHRIIYERDLYAKRLFVTMKSIRMRHEKVSNIVNGKAAYSVYESHAKLNVTPQK